MGDIRIRVGVALDANVKTVYRPIELAAQQAAQNVMRALNTGHKLAMKGAQQSFSQVPNVIGHPYREAAKVAEVALKGLAKTGKQQADAMAKDVERAANERVRFERQALKEIERDLEQSNRRQQQIVARAEANKQRERDRFAHRVGHSFTHGFSAATPSLHTGTRIAHDIARGAGIEFDSAAMLNNYRQRQDIATKLANEAWIGAWDHPDTAINGSQKKVDPKQLMKESSDIAMQTGMEGGPMALLSGLREFVAKTGDLKTARDIMKDLAVFSKATGTSMEDSVEAAGEIANQLPKEMSQEQRITAIRASMMALGGQGEVGSVHIRQLIGGGGIAKLAGSANAFTLDSSTAATLQHAGLNDGISQNIAVMGALTQAARKRGGRSSPTLAANSAMAFIQDMSGRTTQKRWAEAFGGNVIYSDASHTRVRDPKALILEALDKTHGAGDKITNLMSNKNSRAVITSFAADYKDAIEAGRKTNPKASAGDLHKMGLDAVSKEFDRYLKVTIDKNQLKDKFDSNMSTDQTKMEIFNQKLQAVADSTAEKLLPALEKLTPNIERAAKAFGDFVIWATDHPGQAIATALSASIAKASIENVLRTGIESMLKRDSGSSAVGGLGSALAIASIAIATAQVGMMVIDKWSDEASKKRRGEVVEDTNGAGFVAHASGQEVITPEDEKKARAELTRLKSARENLIANPEGSDMFNTSMKWLGRIATFGQSKDVDEAQQSFIEEQKRALVQNEKDQNRVKELLDKIANGKIQVVVVNQPPPPDGSSHPVAAPIGGH